MLSPNWIAFIATIYIIGMILGLTMSGGDPFSAGTSVTNGLSTPTMSVSWLSSIWSMVTLDFSFFHAYFFYLSQMSQMNQVYD